MSILKNPPPEGGNCPPLEPDLVAKEAEGLGLSGLPVMSSTYIGPYSILRNCETTANFLWGETHNKPEAPMIALQKAVDAFLASKGLCHIWLPNRSQQLRMRERIVRILHAASKKLGIDRVRELGYHYSQRVLFLEEPIPTEVGQFLRGILGEHAPQFFPVEDFPEREREVLRALRKAKPDEFVSLTTTGEAGAVRRLQQNHGIRIESWKEAKAAGRTGPRKPGKGMAYRLIRDI